MKIQIAKAMFLCSLSVLKSILSLLEFKFGKNSDDYKYFRKQIFDYFYSNLKGLFEELIEKDLVNRCSNKCNLRQGYKDCICGGSGYTNAET